jgi:hypothetical protein
VRPRPAFEARPQVDGVTSAGTTGMEVDAHGRVAARTCPRCQTRLDDVDGRGTHPWCEPTGGLPVDPDRSRT